MTKKSLNKYRMTWVRSFLLTITIVLAVFLIIFLYVLLLTRQEELERNYSESQFLKNVLDDKFRSAAYLSADILYRPASLFPEEENETVYNSLNAYRLVGEMQSHKVSHSEIEDIFVYYPNSDIIVGTYGVRTSRTYYYLQGTTSEGYETWQKELLNNKNIGYMLYKPTNSKTTEPQLILCNSLYLNEKNNCRIFLKIRQGAIEQVLSQANTDNFHQFAALVDKDNNIYSSYGDKKLFLSCNNLEKSGSVNGYQVTVQSSLLDVFKYITISDKSQVQQLSGKISLMLVAGVLVSGIASIIAAFYFSGRNAKPVSKILNRIADSEPEGDAFDYIGKTIDNLMQYNSTITEQLERQQRITATSFLPLIFNGERHDESFLTSFAAIYGVDFAFPYYGVLVTRFSQAQTAATVMNHIIDWVLHYQNENFDVTCGVVNGNAVCLMNWDSDDNDVDDAPMFHFSSALCDLMQENSYQFRIGVGGMYQKLSNIHLSYSEALYVLDKYDQLLCFYDICPNKLGDDTNGTMYYEYQRKILERNYQSAYLSLHELLEENLFNCTPAVYKHRKSALLQILHEAVSREVSDKSFAEKNEQKCLSLLYAEVEPKQLEINLGEIFKVLIGLTTQPQESGSSVAVKAASIIDRNFSDPTLGLSCIASQLNVTGPYLSRAFKQEYPLGMSEYISKVRIEHAKALIIKGELSVKTIALKVGFSSDVNFIRVFKKLENTTPGKFASN